MYNDYYGFREEPFNIVPDPRFLFYSPQHREAFDHLYYGITQRKGFIALTGEVGTGKTTVCRALLDQLGPNYATALILNPCLSWPQMLRAILTEFGQTPTDRDRQTLLQQFNTFLLQQVHAGRDAVLIIDEAQDLPSRELEQVRLLSNLETDRRKLVQIVLVGQPELREKLRQPELRQLRQRITVHYHIRPLTRDEADAYIAHRLRLCAAHGFVPSFDRWARRRIYRYSAGVPRLINAVCDKTLLCGYVSGSYRFKLRHVRRAIDELEGKAA